MATTIQISEKVKKKLFQIINKMEQELGRRISYNEAIEKLIENSTKRLSKNELINHIEKYMGIFDINEARKLLKEERELDLERERKFSRH
ncbi:MAG: hypothetical protein ACTSWX_12115 [Promethearchaeota archaeon]